MSMLQETLLKQLEAAKALLAVLNREYEAIRARDATALNTIAPEKLKGTQALEALEDQRKALDSVAGSAVEPAHNVNPSSQNSPIWNQIIDIVRLCNRKNQLNGVMLELRQEQVSRAMELLAGQTSEATVYTSAGVKKASVVYGGTSLSA